MNSQEFQQIHNELITEILKNELKRFGVNSKIIDELKTNSQLWEYYQNIINSQ